MLIEANNVTKAFGAFKAVDDASVSVEEGDILGLIGPNGAGKSTFFNCLTGDLPARPSAWKEGGLGEAPRTAAFWTQLAHVRSTPKIPERERIAQKVTEHAEAAIRGRVDVDGALAALDRDVDAILEKRRWMLARR